MTKKRYSGTVLHLLAKRFDVDHTSLTWWLFNRHLFSYTHHQRNVSLVEQENEERYRS